MLPHAGRQHAGGLARGDPPVQRAGKPPGISVPPGASWGLATVPAVLAQPTTRRRNPCPTDQQQKPSPSAQCSDGRSARSVRREQASATSLACTTSRPRATYLPGECPSTCTTTAPSSCSGGATAPTA